MPTFRVHFSFDGRAYADIEAKDSEQAEILFYDGYFIPVYDGLGNYVVEEIDDMDKLPF